MANDKDRDENDSEEKQSKLRDAEYELVPFEEIDSLKKELSKLKEFPVPSAKKLQISIEDLAMKLDRLTAIMEEAAHMVKVEEGGTSFEEKMRPLVNKMNKVLDQNAEIAKGILAVADLVNDVKEKVENMPSPEVRVTTRMPGMMSSAPREMPPMPGTMPPLPGTMPPPPMPGDEDILPLDMDEDGSMPPPPPPPRG